VSGNQEEDDYESRRLFVRNLSSVTTTASLKESFSKFGEIDNATVVFDKETRVSKLYGFVVFKFVESANRALLHADREIDGRVATISRAGDFTEDSKTFAKVKGYKPPSKSTKAVPNSGTGTGSNGNSGFPARGGSKPANVSKHILQDQDDVVFVPPAVLSTDHSMGGRMSVPMANYGYPHHQQFMLPVQMGANSVMGQSNSLYGMHQHSQVGNPNGGGASAMGGNGSNILGSMNGGAGSYMGYADVSNSSYFNSDAMSGGNANNGAMMLVMGYPDVNGLDTVQQSFSNSGSMKYGYR